MCVIIIADTVKPSEAQIAACYDTNPSGAGIAWREGGYVHWKKGLKLDDIKALCEEKPLPYVAHFRIPSCGGSGLNLCHPFPVEKTAPVDLEGKTKGMVLFHNGHWGDWKKTMLQAVVHHKFKVPGGDKWSDSRAMAWLAAHYGVPTLDLLDEKIVAFGPNECEVYGIGAAAGWVKVGELWFSNRHWEHKVSKLDVRTDRHPTGNIGTDHWRNTRRDDKPLCQFSTCNKHATPTTRFCHDHQPQGKVPSESNYGVNGNVRNLPSGGGRFDIPPFCGSSQVVQGRETQQDEVQEGEETMGDGYEASNAALAKWARSFNPKPMKLYLGV